MANRLGARGLRVLDPALGAIPRKLIGLRFASQSDLYNEPGVRYATAKAMDLKSRV